MRLAFRTSFVRAHPYGILAGVVLPAALAPVPDEVLARLHPAERAVAGSLGGWRLPEWVGARLAWAEALRALGAPAAPLGSDPAGAPLPPAGLAASVTHKRDLAVVLVGPAEAGALGVDLEGEGRAPLRIASRVLRPEELARLEGLGDDRAWLELMVRFAVKEATYKAVHPRLQRYVGFHEATVEVDLSGVAASAALPDLSLVETRTEPRVTLHVAPAPALASVAEHAGGRVLAAVRARW
jgi:4'-phosphopantetheinyl transferase EntD